MEKDDIVDLLTDILTAVKKQVPMKVTDIHVDEYFCPACGAEICCDQGKVYDHYCPECGQALAVNGDGV